MSTLGHTEPEEAIYLLPPYHNHYFIWNLNKTIAFATEQHLQVTTPNKASQHQRALFFRASSRAISLISSGDGGLGASGGYTT